MASGKRKKGRASRPPSRKPVIPQPVTPRPPSSKRPPSKPPSSGPPSPRSEPARSARDVYRARRIRTGITALVMVVVLSVTTVVLVYLHRLNPQERRLLAEAPAAARSAGCRPVRTISPYPGGLDRAHIGTGGPVPTLPELATYPSDPPASGPHSSVPADAGEYADPPSIAEAIHSLEHGAAIIWLSPDALSNAEVARIETFFRRRHEQNHVIVSPFDYPDQGSAGRLPAGTEMTLVAWHRLQLCDRPSLAAAFSFVERFRFNLWRRGSYRGEAPERYSPI